MKTRYPLDVAAAIADHLVGQLTVACERITIAGSIRRRRPTVGDIELLYIPKVEPARNPADFFGALDVNQAELAIQDLLTRKVLAPRLNSRGRATFGALNKLLLHVPSGIPVDLFTTPTPPCWWSMLVCRTGPAESNTRLAQAANARGWSWNVYGPGFTHLSTGQTHPVGSEHEVFEFVGLPYLPPERRQ